MFEAAITSASAEPGVENALRPLDWCEIVARLAAARDLRAILSPSASLTRSASFAAGAGTTCALHGQPAVNLDALGGGKAPAMISVATETKAATGDQGTR